MFAENRKISLRQMQILLLLDTFGTAVLFLPAELTRLGGRGCWLLALAGGLFFVVFSFLLAKVGCKMPEGTVVDWCRFCFGEGIAAVVLIGLAGKLLFDGVLELRILSEIICRSMLPNTPVWVISLLILAVAGSLAAQGTECRGRAAEILFFVVAVPLVIILIAVVISAKYGRVLPLELPALSEFGTGISVMSVVFQGLVFLYFIFPDLRKPAMTKGAVVESGLVMTILITVIVFLCLAVYGEGVLAEKLLPALQMMERVSFTGVFLTRQDVLLLWFWMAAVCVYLSGVLFYGSLLGVHFRRQAEEKRKPWLWRWLAALFFLSFLPDNLSVAYQWRLNFAPWGNLLYLVLLPVALLLMATRKGGKGNA